MNWYYEKNKEQKGPVSEEALRQLLQNGELTRENLVWREGFEDWVSYGSVFQDEGGIPGGGTCPNCGSSVHPDQLIPAGEVTVCPNCRDQYLQRINEGVSVHSDDEALEIRTTHIKHEASLKSVGLLYYLGAFFTLFGGLSVIFLFTSSPGEGLAGPEMGFMLGIAIFYVILAVVMILVGRGFRKLKRWTRIPGTIISGLGLLSFPIGTVINGYILYLIWSQKGKMIFSDGYQDIIQATPDVKYKTSPVVIVILILLVVFLLAAMLFGIASA